MITAELVYKFNPWNAWVQFYGEYPTPELDAAIKAAGWARDAFPAPRLDPQFIEPHTRTESYYQPEGTDIFHASTHDEGTRLIKRLRAALKPFGIRLARARRQTFQEAI